MESPPKHGGLDGTAAPSGGRSAAGRKMPEAVLRFLALALTLAAAIVMGLATETKTVPISVVPTLPPQPVSVTAKATYSSAFKYFIIANAIVCTYSLLSLIASMAKGQRRGCGVQTSVADLVALALLFSSIGAAAAIGVLGRNGDPHTGWKKICNAYSKFCTKITIALILSLAGSMAYVILMILKVASLHRRSV